MKKVYFGFLLLTGFPMAIWIAIFGMPTDENSQSELSLVHQAMVIWVPLSLISLWLWMISEYFSAKDSLKDRVAWGFFLIFASFFAAAIFFLGVYLPRVKREIGKEHA